MLCCNILSCWFSFYSVLSAGGSGVAYCNERVSLFACVCVDMYLALCWQAYLRNYMSDLYQFLYMYGGGSVRLWQRCDTFTSGFVACGWPGLGDAKKSYTQGISTGSSADLTARRIFRPTLQGQHRPYRSRSTIALSLPNEKVDTYLMSHVWKAE